MHFTCFCVSTLSGRWNLETQECSPSLAGNFVHSFHIYACSFSRRNENIVKMWQKTHENYTTTVLHRHNTYSLFRLLMKSAMKVMNRKNFHFLRNVHSTRNRKSSGVVIFKMRECKTKKTWKVNTFSSSGGELTALSNNEDKQEITWEGRENSPFLYIIFCVFLFSFVGTLMEAGKKAKVFT